MRQLGYSLFILAVAAGSASAAGPTVDAQFLGIMPSVNFKWSVVGSGFAGNPSPAGCFTWQRTGGTYAGAQGNFTTFCLELTQDIQDFQNYSYKVVSPTAAPSANAQSNPLGVVGADRMAELFGRFYGTLNTSNAVDCAAFQLAVWGIVYDANLVLNEPADTLFYRDPAGNLPGIDVPFTAAFNQAQFFLSSINGLGPRSTLDAFTNQNDQDQIIPTPGAFALLGLGGLATARRRRR